MKIFISILCVVLFLSIIGCSTHIHTVGKGPQNNTTIQNRQWYALAGIVPINNIDTLSLADNAENYEIKTETSLLDFIINLFTMFGTVTSRTVTITK